MERFGDAVSVYVQKNDAIIKEVRPRLHDNVLALICTRYRFSSIVFAAFTR